VFFNFLDRFADAKDVAKGIHERSPANLELYLLEADFARAEDRRVDR
jgi:hypothetical protein